MNILSKDTVITLDNDAEYGVTEVINVDNCEYAFLINIKNPDDFRVCKINKDPVDKEIEVEDVNEEELKLTVPEFYKKIEEYLK